MLALPAPAWARAGRLDPTFGSGGIVTAPSSSLNEAFGGLELEPDGRLVAGGTSDPGFSPARLVLAKYLSSGALDPSFGSGGVSSLLPDPGFSGFTGGPARQTDGHLIVSGIALPSSPPFFYRTIVARYDAGGSPDSTFGTGGVATLDSASGSFVLGGPVLQDDGKILLGGYVGPGLGEESAIVARLDASGSLDSTFGSGGVASVSPVSQSPDIAAIVVQPDGKVVAAGSIDIGSDPGDFFVARVDASGALDPTFGSGGTTHVDLGGYDFATSIVRQPDGKLVVAGGGGASADRIGIVRFDTNGMLDASFGNGGVVITSVTGDTDFAEALVLAPDGKLVVAGSAGGDVLLARYLADGTLDTSFGDGGVATTPVGAGAVANGLVRQPDGKLVVAGSTTTGDGTGDFLVARYGVNGCPEAPLAGCKTPTAPHRSKLIVRNRTDAARDTLAWKWTRGAATTLPELGDPLAGTDYRLCIYDTSGVPVLFYESSVPAGASWSPAGSTGFRYRSKDGLPEGTTAATLRSGPAGAAKASLKGQDAHLGPPVLPLPLPARVQLQSSGGTCFEATYSNAGVGVNNARAFKGRSD
ncbi:MAG TPA: hypothetical protein VKU61_00475 [Candidatus Binatia bacterium]|nr:hypothetical protein [Candidatus Binatia bacterium]